jgi:hypothetical protein
VALIIIFEKSPASRGFLACSLQNYAALTASAFITLMTLSS